MGDSTHTAGGPRAVVPCASCGTLNRVQLNRLADGPRCADCRSPLTLDRPLTLTESLLDRVVAGTSAPILVDFYADWCGPCRIMAPALEAFARAQAGRVVVLKLDTDANPSVSARFGIRGIPTLIAFRGGREAGRHTGVANDAIMARLAGS